MRQFPFMGRKAGLLQLVRLTVSNEPIYVGFQSKEKKWLIRLEK